MLFSPPPPLLFVCWFAPFALSIFTPMPRAQGTKSVLCTIRFESSHVAPMHTCTRTTRKHTHTHTHTHAHTRTHSIRTRTLLTDCFFLCPRLLSFTQRPTHRTCHLPVNAPRSQSAGAAGHSCCIASSRSHSRGLFPKGAAGQTNLSSPYRAHNCACTHPRADANVLCTLLLNSKRSRTRTACTSRT